jgi:RNA polymerase sigma-70 factor (ECF subfamily)
MDAFALRSCFGEHCPVPIAALEVLPDVGERLAAALRAGREAWPDVRLSDATFVAFLAERMPDQHLEEGLARLCAHAADLYLACALAAGDPEAVAEWEAGPLAQVPAFVAHIGKSPEFADEVKQRVRERLLVARGGPPRIAEYAGRGPLGGMVRVTAVRIAIDMRRGEGSSRCESLDDAVVELAAASADPETEYWKRYHAAEFADAFAHALSRLPAADRALLRMHHLEGLGIDPLATMLGIHRASVARRLAKVRARLLEATQAQLLARCGVPAEELDAFMAEVRSRFQLSVRRFLSP